MHGETMENLIPSSRALKYSKFLQTTHQLTITVSHTTVCSREQTDKESFH